MYTFLGLGKDAPEQPAFDLLNDTVAVHRFYEYSEQRTLYVGRWQWRIYFTSLTLVFSCVLRILFNLGKRETVNAISIDIYLTMDMLSAGANFGLFYLITIAPCSETDCLLVDENIKRYL